MLDIYNLKKKEAFDKNIVFSIAQPITQLQSKITIDKNKLETIFDCLINNAIKFTAKGIIEMGYNLIEINNQSFVEFYIKDSGIGIKPEMTELIFKPFRQGDEKIHINYGGNGLGLSIAKGYVELLGGNIRVVSEYEKGSIFYFTIPYSG